MTYKASVATGLPNIADPPDPSFFPEFTRVYNAIRTITIALDTYTGALPAEPQYYNQTPASSSIRNQNLLRLYVNFGVAIAVGQTVNLYDVAGVPTARLADATAAGKPMHGFCSIAAGAGSYGEIMLGGLLAGFTGLVTGTTYYQSNTPGSMGVGAGTIVQRVGFAVAPTMIFVQPTLV